MMKEEQKDDTKKLIRKMKRMSSIISNGFTLGDYDKTLKYVEKEEQLIKHFQGDIPEEIKGVHTLWLWCRGIIYAYRGDLALCIMDANELLRVGQLYNHKRGISDGTYLLGIYYHLSGEFDRALEHVDRAIRLSEENLNDLWDFVMLAGQLHTAIFVSIDKGDIERAKKYFKRLGEIWKLKGEFLSINDLYRMDKGWLLKSSMRFRDRVLAEDLFREIIEDDSSIFMFKLAALSGLCELLIVELRISNDITIINEIKPLLEKLSIMAQHSGLYYWLIEAYILNGKLALIMFDMENSRLYLTQAQYMAEKHGYIGLANEIKGLHEAMMEKKDIWAQMEKNDAPLSERMDLARLDEHLNGRFRMRMMRMERVTDTLPKKEVF